MSDDTNNNENIYREARQERKGSPQIFLGALRGLGGAYFPISDAGSPLGAEGIPYVFKSFDLQGTVASLDLFESGEGWQPQGDAEPRQLEIPIEMMVVQFP